MTFNTLGLSDRVLRGIEAVGYVTPTEIQVKAIPPAVAGSDVIGRAETGSGKTAAFVLPIIDRLSAGGQRSPRSTRSLILTPTRELAVQIEEAAIKYSRFLKLRVTAVFGGVSINPQFDRLRHGVDVLVATPGRLLDHLERGTVDLSECEVLVVDEADRMFDMGFIHDVRKIVDKVGKSRQTMLFSATMSKEVRALTAGIMHDPVLVEVGANRKPAETVRQHFYLVQKERKLDLLFHLLGGRGLDSVLVFSRTKHGADKIHRKLERSGIASAALHSNRSQVQRQRALEEFKRGRVRVLVATDIAARGIDVTGISHVINFDTPGMAEDYIHRIGRTGRASAEGDAITFVSNAEFPALRKIENFVGRRYTLMQEEGVPVHASSEEDRGSDDRRDRNGSDRRGRGGDDRRGRSDGERRDRGNDSRSEFSSGNRRESGSGNRRESGSDNRREFGGDNRREFGGDNRREFGGDNRREFGSGSPKPKNGDTGYRGQSTGRGPAVKKSEGGMRTPKRKSGEGFFNRDDRRDSRGTDSWSPKEQTRSASPFGERDRGFEPKQEQGTRPAGERKRTQKGGSMPEWAQKKRRSGAPTRYGSKRG